MLIPLTRITGRLYSFHMPPSLYPVVMRSGTYSSSSTMSTFAREITEERKRTAPIDMTDEKFYYSSLVTEYFNSNNTPSFVNKVTTILTKQEDFKPRDDSI